MGDLERRQDLAVRGGLDQRAEMPSELAAAILEAANILREALPPGVQFELRFDDSSQLMYSPAVAIVRAARGKSTKARMVEGRLEVRLRIEGREGAFVPHTGCTERRVDAEGALADHDGDGAFDTIHMTNFQVTDWLHR